MQLIGSATHNQSLNLVVAASIPSDLLLKLNVRKANAIQGGLIMPGGKVSCYRGCQGEEYVSSFRVLSRISDRWESTRNEETNSSPSHHVTWIMQKQLQIQDYMGCFDSSNDKFEMIFLRYKGIIFQTHDNFSSRTVKITMRKELESDSDYFSYLLSS